MEEITSQVLSALLERSPGLALGGLLAWRGLRYLGSRLKVLLDRIDSRQDEQEEMSERHDDLLIEHGKGIEMLSRQGVETQKMLLELAKAVGVEGKSDGVPEAYIFHHPTPVEGIVLRKLEREERQRMREEAGGYSLGRVQLRQLQALPTRSPREEG